MKNSFKTSVRNALIIANGTLKKIKGDYIGKRVIAIHDVNDPKIFRHKMQWLHERYEILSIGDLLKSPHSDKIQLAITFDDGYRSWYENVLPVLDELRIPATFFICSGFVGLEGKEARDFINNCLKRKQVFESLRIEHVKMIAENSLFEIGGHTTNHKDLGKTYGSEVLLNEIIRDRERLEGWASTRIRWFAYPFGGRINFSEQSKEFVRNSGYEAAFTIIPGFVRNAQDYYAIGRDSLNIHASDLLWKNWLNGGYDRIRA